MKVLTDGNGNYITIQKNQFAVTNNLNLVHEKSELSDIALINKNWKIEDAFKPDKVKHLNFEKYPISFLETVVENRKNGVVYLSLDKKVGFKLKSYNIMKRDKFICQHCGAKGNFVKLTYNGNPIVPTSLNIFVDDTNMLTIDHVLPKSANGTNDVKNLKCLCEKCNLKKANQIVNTNFYKFDVLSDLRKEMGQKYIESIEPKDEFTTMLEKTINNNLNKLSTDLLVQNSDDDKKIIEDKILKFRFLYDKRIEKWTDKDLMEKYKILFV